MARMQSRTHVCRKHILSAVCHMFGNFKMWVHYMDSVLWQHNTEVFVTLLSGIWDLDTALRLCCNYGAFDLCILPRKRFIVFFVVVIYGVMSFNMWSLKWWFGLMIFILAWFWYLYWCDVHRNVGTDYHAVQECWVECMSRCVMWIFTA
jgi:hypothetical protein